MPSPDRIAMELARRVEALPRELTAWKQAALANTDGQGIHRNQVLAVDELMSDHVGRLRDAAGALPPPGGATYADAYVELLDQLVEVHELWQVFRGALAQRRDPFLRPVLHAADIVAADAYRACLATAGVATDDRAPPLVYLEAARSPATLARGEEAGKFHEGLRGFRDVGLPIPLVLLPGDHADSLWLHCAVLHEVGHDVDAELELSDELQRRLLALSAATLGDRSDTWWRWMPEVLADAFGVALGDAGFVKFLARALRALAPAARFSELRPKEPHPSPHLRVPLLCELLRRQRGGAWKTEADAIADAWRSVPAPPFAQSHLADLPVIVDLVMSSPLARFGGKKVEDVAASGADPVLLRKLAGYLAGKEAQPNAAALRPPFRTVPAAAELAFSDAPGPDAAALAAIHDRALRYLAKIPRPEFLAGPTDSDLRRVFAARSRRLPRLRRRSTP